jgi:hypothetical protein
MTDADDLLKSLREPIAVVGNGWIRHQHDAIESHPTIIRFNNFADVGYEQHVGHRCDVWCVTCCGAVKFRDEPIPHVMTIATLEEQPGFIPAWLDRYPDMAVPRTSWISEARKAKQYNPSTGITLLCRLIHHAKRFTAFGFSGLAGGHYWDPMYEHLLSHGNEFPAMLELAKRGAVFK